MRNGRWLIAAICLVGAVGCGPSDPAARPEGPMKPSEVSVNAPVRKTIHYTVEQPGRIEPFEQTPIYSRISGYVRAVRVEVGDRVKRGDLLAELDVPERVEEHHRKEALVAQARLGIAQAEQAERVAEATVESARADVEVTRSALA